MSEKFRIRCNTVRYRQGFIEITAGIHKGHVNVEAWAIAPEADISDLDIRSGAISDDAVTANTELELTAEDARHLGEAILAAAREAAE